MSKSFKKINILYLVSALLLLGLLSGCSNVTTEINKASFTNIKPEEAEKKLKDKDAPIFVYCRSGNRSTSAASILVNLGYKNVYNLGGINNWPYEIVK
jgi:phage shock protein E